MADDWRRRSRFQGKKFRSFALAVGQMNLAFNDFHEELGMLFLDLLVENGAFSDAKTHMRALTRVRLVWGHLTSDRQKRDLVELLANWLHKAVEDAFPTLKEDLQFLVRKGHSLEDKRNDVIHAPVDIMMNALASGLPGQAHYGDIYTASAFNKRARKFGGSSTRKTEQELLISIRLYRDYATVLALYARDLREAWRAAERGRRRAWPHRPRVPQLKEGG